jgi:formylglycine-generating enzyme required for sulfatase activity
VDLPGGTFLMGSPTDALSRDGDRKGNEDELPRRRLTLPALQICKTEVTQAHYEAVMGINPSFCPHGCGDDLPVQNVSWFDALAYLNKLTALESAALAASGKAALTACYEGSGDDMAWVEGCTGYRLPTEAEWEYAARAGTTTSWSFGEDPADLGAHAWYWLNASDRVNVVGGRKANPWGLHDLHGNVWEWVWDAYDSYKSHRVVNNQGTRRALRGGSFNVMPGFLRSAERNWGTPKFQARDLGFRCARGPGPQR